ncbi:glycoside hydrolase superfamily [Mycena galericulata]|nr:glycoside hydrolase superfamily [Mycena galericulata]
MKAASIRILRYFPMGCMYFVSVAICFFLCHAAAASEQSLKITVPKGFVTTRGAEFELDGSPFAFVGANSYWLPLLTTMDDVEFTMQQMQDAGVKVLRTWGFNAINASELAGALQSNLTYYQVWNNSDWSLNDGTQGLQRLDNVLNAASKHDIKNEARCLGDLPASPACVPGSGTLGKWYKEQSDFVRSLDPYHMITTGGEGHFYWRNPAFASDYNFNGQAGEDFDYDLTLPNIDFGSYHMYPQTWYPQLDFPGSNFSVEAWGLFWIDSHVSAAKKCWQAVDH